MNCVGLTRAAALVCVLLPALMTASAQTRVDRSLSIPPPAANPSAPSPALPLNAIPAVPATPAANPLPITGTTTPRRGGAYSASAMGPTILAKNAEYETVFKVGAGVPPGSTINQVSWRYGLSSRPVGLEAVLCWRDRQLCWTVTDSAAGNTLGFNGRDASEPFTLHYRVKGGGPLGPPVQGQMNQIIVNYDLP